MPIRASRFSSWILFPALVTLLAFPLVDAVLRNLPIPALPSLWDELVLVLLTAGAFGIALMRAEWRKHPATVAIPVAMLGGSALLVLGWDAPVATIEGYRAVFQYMLAFYIGIHLPEHRPGLRLAIRILLMAGMFVALVGIYQYISGAPMLGGWVSAGESISTRAYSIVGSPNALGSQMALLGPIALGFALSTRHNLEKLFWLGAFVIFTACLVVTFSRGAWLAFAGGLAIVAGLQDRRLFWVGLIAGLALALGLDPIRERLLYLMSPDYLAASMRDGRIARWVNAFDLLRAEPIFGLGLGHYGGAVAERRFGTTYVDNYYVKTAAEMGIIGLGLFLWLIVRLMRGLYQSWQSTSGSSRWLAAGLFAGLLAVLLHNSVENIFEIPYLNLYFWLIAGWLAAMPYLGETDRTGQAGRIDNRGGTGGSPSGAWNAPTSSAATGRRKP